ncbi:MAG TPA: MFS transporter [Anaerolineae bacterium]|nr:MFS transporter [Anaerolineae bacterium]HQK14566.1 MFS transporter [Anaerolineae bacterium]
MKQTPSRAFRLSMFAALYVVQGVGLAYFSNFQKPYLDSLGISPNAIGALTFVLQIPFILKIFIGMLSDKINLLRMGHRKPYMLLGLVLAALAFGGATFTLPDTNFLLFAVLVTLGSFSVTLFDSTTDGLAIDTTPHDEQALVQGVMVGGRAAAFIALSLIFGMLVQRTGYRIVFPIIGLSMLLPLLWVVRIHEPPRDATARFQWGAFKALGQPRFLLFALYAVVYSIGSFGTDGLVTYFMRARFGVTEGVIGQYGALRGIGAIIGALAGGVLIDRLGRKRSAYAGVILISVMAALIGAATGAQGVLWLGLVWGAVWAFQETLFFALAMDIADARIAASMFAIMMGISNLGSAVADGLATALSDDLGFVAVFGLLAVINLITLPVLWGLFKKAPEIANRAE